MDGLTSLAGLQSLTVDAPEASPEEIQGGTADPRHSQRGEKSRPYSWESQEMIAGSHGPYGPPDDALLDETLLGYSIALPAGQLDEDPYGGRAPWTHAGPWPSDPIGDGSVQPDNTARQLQQNYDLRALAKPTDHNKSNVYSRAFPLQDKWEEIWEINPGGTDLETVGPQMRAGMAPGGRGHTDRVQSNAHQNSYGFDSKHQHRRYAAGRIPGNFLWLRAIGRPLIKSLAGPARPPVGQGSPFAGQNLGAAFTTNGAILQTPPMEYQGPPSPYVAPDGATPTDGYIPAYEDFYGLGDG